MANGASSQAISGAAQGAVSGAMIGGVPGAIAGGIIGGIGGLISGSSADAQQANQSAWARYNNDMQLGTDMYNINSRYNIAGLNAAMAVGQANVQNAAIDQSVAYDTAMIYGTTVYNNLLMEQELARVWQDEDLELEQLEDFRARERGGIIVDQAASGTVIDEGSNKEVVISQKAQEAMDANIVMFNADRAAADINNQMAQSRWQGQVSISQTIFNGEVQKFVNSANASIQATSIMAQAKIQKDADTYTANQRYYMGGVGIDMNNQQYTAQNTQNMIGGLFNAGATAATYGFASKVPGANKAYTTSGGGGGAPGGGTLVAPTYISQNAPASPTYTSLMNS